MTRDEKNFRIWLAGFIDGDGSMCIIRSRQYSPRLVVYQSEPNHSIIFEISKRYGGYAKKFGYPKQYGQMWGCEWSHRKAKKMVEYLLPYFKVKQLQAQEFLKYFEYRLPRYPGPTAEELARREELVNSVNKFNHRNSTPSEAEREHLQILNELRTCDGHTPATLSEGLRDDLLSQVTVS